MTKNITSLLTAEQKDALKDCLGRIYPPSGKSTYFRAYREEEDGLVIVLEFKSRYEIKIPYFEVEDFIARFYEATLVPDELLIEELPATATSADTGTPHSGQPEGGTVECEVPAPERRIRTRARVMEIISRSPLTHKELHKAIGMNETSLYYHTTALKREGYIFIDKSGRYNFKRALAAVKPQTAVAPLRAAPPTVITDSTINQDMKGGQDKKPGNSFPNKENELEEILIRCMDYHKSKYENLKRAMEIISQP